MRCDKINDLMYMTKLINNALNDNVLGVIHTPRYYNYSKLKCDIFQSIECEIDFLHGFTKYKCKKMTQHLIAKSIKIIIVSAVADIIIYI